MYQPEEQRGENDGVCRSYTALPVLSFSLEVQQSAEHHSAAEPFLEERCENRDAEEIHPYAAFYHIVQCCLKPLRHRRHQGIDAVHREGEGQCPGDDQCAASYETRLAEMFAVQGDAFFEH